MGHIEVISPGIFSSIQDAGRVGFAHYGVPRSGAMDQRSMHRANAILGNALDTPVLEFTFRGPQLKFSTAVEIVVSGADLEIQVNQEAVNIDEIISIPANGLLSFGKAAAGTRGYIAIAGGFQTTQLMGSNSWSRQLTNPFRLSKGMNLAFGKINRSTVKNIPEKTDLYADEFEVIPGPEFDWLTAPQQKQLFSQRYRLLPNSDRMAFSFSSEGLLPFPDKPFLTSPVMPGVVQWYPSGQLVLLHRDAQRTGGYPRILIFTAEALNQIAQIGIGVTFGLTPR